jgi:anhydro-N-acetylmuramic acid kinase
MERIATLAAPATIHELEELGLPAQAKEAYLFALLGYLAAHGLEGTIPSATGARSGSILGSLTPGAEPITLPAPVTAAPRRLRIVA